MDKLQYIQATGYDSAQKEMRYQVMRSLWHRGVSILVSERSQYEEVTCCMIPTIWHSGTGETMETIKHQWFPGVGGRKC